MGSKPRRRSGRDVVVVLVSIVIPCFNEEEFLSEAIDSALAQAYPNIETIVVDDGSTDRSVEIAQRYGDRVQIRRKANGGLSSARNCGIDAAKGEYVTFLDADDRLHPDFVAKTAAMLEADPTIGFVYTQMEYFGRESKISTWPEYSIAELVRGNFVSATSLIRASLFREVRFDERLRTGWEDWDFFLSLAERGHTGRRIDEPLFLYRKHADASRLSDTMVETVNKRKTRLAIMRKHLRLFGVRKYLHYFSHHIKETARSRGAHLTTPRVAPEE
jgi:glycosyltransferase involved in cell wall biosynthesis